MTRIFLIGTLFSVLISSRGVCEDIVLSPRTTKIPTYPCSECHRESLSRVTPLEIGNPRYGQDHKKMVFKHMAEVTECFLCHSEESPNELVLLDGVRISYNSVPLLCGQCHGLKKTEWDLGIHGRYVGSWRDGKTKFACTECHHPHRPQFPQLKAFAPPKFPKFGIRKGEH